MKQTKITISLKLRAGVRFDKEADIWVAYTPALGIFIQGKDPESAKSVLEDAVQSYLLLAYKNGLLEKCLDTTPFRRSEESVEELKESGNEEYISISEERIPEKSVYMNIMNTFELSTGSSYPLAIEAT